MGYTVRKINLTLYILHVNFWNTHSWPGELVFSCLMGSKDQSKHEWMKESVESIDRFILKKKNWCLIPTIIPL